MRFAVVIPCTLALAGVALRTDPASASPFDGRGMWIWYVSRSDGGSSAAIAARARANGIDTVFIKSGDGTDYWRQFSASIVRSLHRAGLHACAWQYVYGTHPIAEAEIGARAVRNGADCLAIDAETQYEGRYAQAQSYIDTLRAAVGRRYPIGLASFPYVDYHPAFPYSVFLGHGGATFNLPQMYWMDIGTSVQEVYRHTYAYNGIYRRPIRPLGQTEGGPSMAEIEEFRGLAVQYGEPAVSWWDWAWTSADGLWPAISGPYLQVAPLAPAVPVLRRGSKGDMVVWLQELLASRFASQTVDGVFGRQTEVNLRRFQRSEGITTTGQTGPPSWRALLRLRAVRVRWAADVRSARASMAGSAVASMAGSAVASMAGSAVASMAGSAVASAPLSATLPARADEIRPPSGRDGPP